MEKRQNRRTLPSLEVRAAEQEGAKRIEGYFAVFGDVYELWNGATESVDPHAFDGALDDDIRCLIDHDTRLVLGRNKAGTLRLWVDDKGLAFSVDINPQDSDAMNLYARVQRGDVSGCSFGFDILEDTMENRPDGSVHWTLKRTKLYEGSICTFPAYQATSAEARRKDIKNRRRREVEEWKTKMKERMKKMALRQLILSDKLNKAKEKLARAQQKAEEQRSAREALETREQELIQAREEVNEETTPEEQQILEEQIEAWEEQEAALTQTENEIAAEIETVQQEIADLEQQLEEVNARGMAKPKAPEQKSEERKERTNMSKYETRRLWFGMDHQERDAFIARDDIKAFAQHVRSMIGNEQRAFTGAELTIPTDTLPLIRQKVEENSKLMKHVSVQRVGGDSKVTILGTIPEAIWTAMCAKINELQFAAGAVTLDGYKVAGYVPLCNSVKEDSDLDLVTLVLELLGKAIGLALDKAILYGVGGRMPTGILTRLARTTAPENYPATAPEWEDLSTTNILAVTGKTGTQLFQAIIEATGAINSDYTNGAMFWAMSHKTRTKLIAQAVTFNAAGAVVAGIENTMPVIGGAIEVLNFIPDDVIIGGYGDMYLLAERAGMELGYSEHAHYLEDETIFRGKARYDGMPVIPGAFVAIGINGNTPDAAAVTFAADKANQTV